MGRRRWIGDWRNLERATFFLLRENWLWKSGFRWTTFLYSGVDKSWWFGRILRGVYSGTFHKPELLAFRSTVVIFFITLDYCPINPSIFPIVQLDFFFFGVNNKVNLIATSTAVQPHHIKKKKKSTLDLSLSSVLTSHRPHSFVILTRELAILFSSISRTDILIFEKR